ncbi:DNA/RNA non-specific endonuclease [Formosa sp. S-31]|uniref:DNA/RNA non-specific endonuclease n=1 Tax=Formosa sp. S-31 TaxID=2790949 RepID=UPI003EBCA7AF
MKRLLSILGICVIIGVYLYEQRLNDDSGIQEAKVVHSRANLESFLPTSTTGQVVVHKYYTLSYNEAYEQAEWVAYSLKKSDLSRADRKRPLFELDPEVTTVSAGWWNYKNSGFDKGHLCPAGDRRFSKEAYNETFLTSNIAPQNHDFNAGLWNGLEQKIRYWVKDANELIIVTGGVLHNNLPKIGKEGVAVPEYFYKIVFFPNGNNSRMLAYLIPNNPNAQFNLNHYIVSVDQLEILTGIDFFPGLEDSLEAELENQEDDTNWPFI